MTGACLFFFAGLRGCTTTGANVFPKPDRGVSVCLQTKTKPRVWKAVPSQGGSITYPNGHTQTAARRGGRGRLLIVYKLAYREMQAARRIVWYSVTAE